MKLYDLSRVYTRKKIFDPGNGLPRQVTHTCLCPNCYGKGLESDDYTTCRMCNGHSWVWLAKDYHVVQAPYSRADYGQYI